MCTGGTPGIVVDTTRLREDWPNKWYDAQHRSVVSYPRDVVGCGVSADLTAAGDRYATASTGDFRGTTVFDTATGLPLTQVDHEPGERSTVRFSPDDQRLLTAGRDGAARVWDAETGEELLELQAEAGVVADVAWSADARHIVTGHQDGNARLWSADDGRLIAEMGGYASAPHVAISADGSRLLTSADGQLHTWTTDTDELLEIAADRVTRTLTAPECERYGIEDCP
jgi:WD40 repeat protein